jgi:hypothetical protein
MTATKGGDERERTAAEFIAHLLEVGDWYASAIELNPYAPRGESGEALKREALEIVARERARP